MIHAINADHTVICELKGIQKSFERETGHPLRVLEDINLDVRANEVVCLIGPSGCGKSTILRILAGLIQPTKGRTFYHGQEMQGLNPGVAIVFQNFALYPWMTVEANVKTVLQAQGLDEETIKAKAHRAISLVGLEGFEEAYPRELSGGMKQRVGMARALSVDPEILFMDEPFSHVDALTAEGLRAEILDIWDDAERNPSSILMVSHDIKEVAYMADRIVVLSANPGRLRTIVENPLPGPGTCAAPNSSAWWTSSTTSSPARSCPTSRRPRPSPASSRASWNRCRRRPPRTSWACWNTWRPKAAPRTSSRWPPPPM